MFCSVRGSECFGKVGARKPARSVLLKFSTVSILPCAVPLTAERRGEPSADCKFMLEQENSCQNEPRRACTNAQARLHQPSPPKRKNENDSTDRAVRRKSPPHSPNRLYPNPKQVKNPLSPTSITSQHLTAPAATARTSHSAIAAEMPSQPPLRRHSLRYRAAAVRRDHTSPRTRK